MKLLHLSGAIATILATNLCNIAYAAELPRKPAAQDKDIEVIYVHGRQHKLEEIKYQKGISNADLFSTNPSIDANNLRNEAGALDIGIRGVQGEGRVPIFIDGSLQSTHTNRGYMGSSDRSYIDSELISQLNVEKGPSSRGSMFGAGAIGGTVQIRTLSAADVLTKGQKAGALVKIKTHNNNKMPKTSNDFQQQQYYQISNHHDTLDFAGGAATLATAMQTDQLDLLVAFSRKQVGNYFAGKHGFDNFTEKLGPWDPLPPVNPNGEVVNTSFVSKSYLAKIGLKLTDDQTLELSSRLHQQEAGEMLASYWWKTRAGDEIFLSSLDANGKEVWRSEVVPEGVEYMPQWKPGSADVRSHHLAYHFAPEHNTLLNAKVNFWHTDAELEQYNALGSNLGPNAGQYFHLYHNKRHGIGLVNSSILQAANIPVSLSYGLSRQQETLAPAENWQDFFRRPGRPLSPDSKPTSRHGRQIKNSLFANAQLELAALELTFNLNHHDAENLDHQTAQSLNFKPKTDLTLAASYPLLADTQLQLKLSNAYRMPSLYESTVSNEVFSYSPDYPIAPENMQLFEAGIEQKFSTLLASQDQLTLGLNYFHTRINDMIASGFLPSKKANASRWDQTFTFTNYDKFELPGVELALNYQHPMLHLAMTYTQYTDIEMCSRLIATAEQKATCNATGFSGGLTPLRVPPKKNWVVSVGKTLLDDQLTLGLTLKGHNAKNHPGGFLSGTGVKALNHIPTASQLDFYANYQWTDSYNAYLSITNLTDRYTVSSGSIVAMPEPGRTLTLGAEIKF